MPNNYRDKKSTRSGASQGIKVKIAAQKTQLHQHIKSSYRKLYYFFFDHQENSIAVTLSRITRHDLSEGAIPYKRQLYQELSRTLAFHCPIP